MKTRTNTASCAEEHLTAFRLDPDKVIYFDIETTGFRASTSSLYMIGWAVRSRPSLEDENRIAAEKHSSCADENQWTVTQIMAESASEEVLLLEHFRNILSRYDTIIEFNGDRFDLPYMREKYEAYGMGDPFLHLRTVDLYREMQPFRKALGLTKLNQKSVEQFLSITREDPYNGGELIDVYRSVRDRRLEEKSGAEAAVNSLFLHNYEDVLGMLAMTPLLAYPLAIQSSAGVRIRATVLNNYTDSDGENVKNKADVKKEAPEIIEAAFELQAPVPRPLHLSFDEFCDVTLAGRLVSVQLHPFSGSLYHFFPDYRNYYYLPEEDMAIHKSVASFVASSHREKAKALNCYVKKQGSFLPQANDSEAPAFRRCYKDPVSWFEVTPEMKQDPAAFSDYIHRLIRQLLQQ